MSQIAANPYLLNIIPLFNVADPTNGIGTSATDVTVSNITTMVNTTNYTVAANGIQPYSGGNIVMTGEIDIVGSLYVNGLPVGSNGGGVNTIVGTSVVLSTGTAGVTVYGTPTSTSTSIAFIAGGSTAFELDSLGRALYKGDGVSSNVNRFWVSSSIFHTDRAAIALGGSSNMSTLFDVWNGDAYFDKSIYVKNDVHCTTLYQISDRRLKSNITSLTGALSTVCELQGVHYDMGGKRSMGFIAQEVAEVVPQAVTTMSGGLMAVDYSKLMPIVVEAIKELAAGLQLLN
jgi:hypothetical protein